VIADTREGWVDSLSQLLNSYLKPEQPMPKFDYSQIRLAGEPIKTFGGTAAGPGPLKRLHESINKLFNSREGNTLTRIDIADIGNLIGVCVVSGNVRRSAELLLGKVDDEDFLNLKNAEVFPERNSYDPKNPGWAWMSNNSVEVGVGDDLSKIVDGIRLNGEPGVIWMDVTRKYGRLIDPPNNKDWRAAGYNPCAEQSLESFECCTLVETYLNRHDSLEDFKRTLKFAYLYAKTVTLLPTHWEETNAIMQRNRRIGTSISGIANFADRKGVPVLREWMDTGYSVIQGYDKLYSEWLGIRESIKMTTVKPSGTVSILAGESPGVHWTPGGQYFLRAIRFSNEDPMLPLFTMANYTVEPASESPNTTSVVFFPVESMAKRSEKDVTIFEKMSLASMAQRHWSDNSVSVTVSFNQETEGEHVGTVLHMFDGQLKTVSFLPMGNTIYPQMPYTQITKQDYEEYVFKLMPIDFAGVYAGLAADAIGEAYCTTDACEIKLIQ
jgi:adenosylcobalamin-dependent ribonucleoside-triphosphate reductase